MIEGKKSFATSLAASVRSTNWSASCGAQITSVWYTSTSELPAASQSLYWPNWSVVDDGIATMLTVSPEVFWYSSSTPRSHCRLPPVSPLTMLRVAAEAEPASSAPSSKPPAIDFSFMDGPPKGLNSQEKGKEKPSPEMAFSIALRSSSLKASGPGGFAARFSKALWWKTYLEALRPVKPENPGMPA